MQSHCKSIILASCGISIAAISLTSCTRPELTVNVSQYHGDLVLSEDNQYQRIQGYMANAIDRSVWLVNNAQLGEIYNDTTARSDAIRAAALNFLCDMRDYVIASESMRLSISGEKSQGFDLFETQSNAQSLDRPDYSKPLNPKFITLSPIPLNAKVRDNDSIIEIRPAYLIKKEDSSSEANKLSSMIRRYVYTRPIKEDTEKVRFLSFAMALAERSDGLRRSVESIDSEAATYVRSINAARRYSIEAISAKNSEQKDIVDSNFFAAKQAFESVVNASGMYNVSASSRDIRLLVDNFWGGIAYVSLPGADNLDIDDKMNVASRIKAKWADDVSAIKYAKTQSFFFNDIVLETSLSLREQYLGMTSLLSFIDKNPKGDSASIKVLKEAQTKALNTIGELTWATDVTKASPVPTPRSTAELAANNERLLQLDKSISVIGELRHRYVPIQSTSAFLGLAQMRDELATVRSGSGLGNQQWVPVTTVNVKGGPTSQTHFVVMRDHVGNWQVKQASANSAQLLSAIQNTSVNLLELYLTAETGGTSAVLSKLKEWGGSDGNKATTDHLSPVLDAIEADIQAQRAIITEIDAKSPVTITPADTTRRAQAIQQLANARSVLEMIRKAIISVKP